MDLTKVMAKLSTMDATSGSGSVSGISTGSEGADCCDVGSLFPIVGLLALLGGVADEGGRVVSSVISGNTSCLAVFGAQ